MVAGRTSCATHGTEWTISLQCSYAEVKEVAIDTCRARSDDTPRLWAG
jgi:hypothetical protein